jgi:SCY1-like protein 2
MDLIQSLSNRIDQEQTRKLQELSHNSVGSPAERSKDFMTFGGTAGTSGTGGPGDGAEVDFEQLVLGKAGGNSSDGANGMFDGGWGDAASVDRHHSPQLQRGAQTPTFSWSTPSPTNQPTRASNAGSLRPTAPPSQQPTFRSITPDEKISSFTALSPSNVGGTSLQASSGFPALQPQTQQSQNTPALNWSTTTAPSTNMWSNQQRTNSSPSLSSMNTLHNSMTSLPVGQPTRMPSQSSTPGFAPPPLPQQQQLSGSDSTFSGWTLPPPPSHKPTPATQPSGYGLGFDVAGSRALGGNQNSGSGNPKSGLDKYESLL